MSQNNVDIQLGSLDFESIKQSIIDYLKTQDVLKDYDYAGSASQVLLDILAYNTLYYGYYANMIASEMFLDTAQKEESIISLVKPLGYVVPGKTSATAKVKIRVGGNGTIVPIYTRFTGNSSSGVAYNFYTTSESSLDDNGENVVTITEGKSLIKEQPLLVDNNTQKGFLSGIDVDIRTIRVEVYNSDLNDDGSEIGWQEWTIVNNIQGGLDESSKVYWLERSELGFFVIFGGNFDSSYSQVGSSITPNQQVRVSYIKSSGDSGNSVGNFTIRDFSVSSAISETISLSSNGSDKPDMEAIRFFAPKWFASQNRAVTIEDCRGILAEAGFITGNEDPYSQFTVWGGETMTPPRYGRLFVSLNETDVENPIAAANAMNILNNKTCVTVIPEFMNVDFYRVMIGGTLFFEPSETQFDSNLLLSKATDRLKELYPNRFDLGNVDTATISSAVNSIDSAFRVTSSDLYLKLIKEVPIKSGGFIDAQNFNNECMQGSIESDLFNPSSSLMDEGNIPVNVKVELSNSNQPIDKNGFQNIFAKTANVSVMVGKWKPSTGMVMIYKSISSDDSINIKVSPSSSGSDKFNIKYNMYSRELLFNLTTTQRV